MTENLIMEDATILIIRLTPEELAALYEQATEPSIEIPYTEILPGYSEGERELATDVARRGLIARQLLEPDDEEGFTLHPMALAIAGGSLLADSSIVILSQTETEEFGSIQFHQYGEDIYLTHTYLPDGLHEFGIFIDEVTYHQAILQAIQFLDSAELTCPPGELSTELLDRVFEQAGEGNTKAILGILKESALSKQTAKQLASTLSEPFTIKTITKLNHEDRTEPERQELTFLQSSIGLWHLQPIAGDADEVLVSLQPTSVSEFQERVQALIEIS
jgi:hypothetical protein